MMLASSGACSLIDFGTARKFGDSFSESSDFSLNELRVASVDYDLVCLGATLASVQHDFLITERSSRSGLREVQGAGAVAAFARVNRHGVVPAPRSRAFLAP